MWPDGGGGDVAPTVSSRGSRGKIHGARRQPPGECLADVFELANTVSIRIHEGAIWQAAWCRTL